MHPATNDLRAKIHFCRRGRVRDADPAVSHRIRYIAGPATLRLTPGIKPTNPEAEMASRRVPMWLDAEDLRRLASQCCCSADTPEEDREQCGRIRFRASAALHKHGLSR